jgi:quinol monooxygenase YgiN
MLAQTPPIATTAEPVTLLFSLTTKEGREKEFADLAATLTKITRAEDDGCLAYVFLQQQNNPREFVLYEQWRDGTALKAHIAHLQKVYGPPRPEGGGIPAAILDLTDQSRTVRYRVVA